jgi:photosystem II stability/assembly factor-like uncharacterized protein
MKNISSISFTTQDVGVMVSSDGSAFRTTNQGESWTMSDIPGEYLLQSVVISGQTGIAVGLQGAILVTNDQGVMWKLLSGSGYEHGLCAIKRAEGEYVFVGRYIQILWMRDYWLHPDSR